MAANRYQAYKVRTEALASGPGGMVVVASREDSLANIKAATWWTSNANLTQADLEHRDAIRGFIRKQRPKSEDGSSSDGDYVPVRIQATDGMEMNGLQVSAAGVISLKGGAFEIT